MLRTPQGGDYGIQIDISNDSQMGRPGQSKHILTGAASWDLTLTPPDRLRLGADAGKIEQQY